MSAQIVSLHGHVPEGVVVEKRLPTESELQRAWEARKGEMMGTCLEAIRWAYHYNRKQPKTYGEALFAYRPATRIEDAVGIFYGWNHTFRQRRKDSWWPKPCGLRAARDAAKAAGFDYCFGVAVYSNNFQADDISKVFCDVQHPCHECRMMMERELQAEAPLILFRDRLPCDFREPGGDRFLVRQTTFGESFYLHEKRWPNRYSGRM
jgi:hypothetical protein